MNLALMITIASGGALGALARFMLGTWISAKVPHPFPFATLGVNLSGSFLMGVLFAYLQYNEEVSPLLKSFLAAGFLGAMTTYSTFAMESFSLIESGRYLAAALNIFSNAVGTIVAVAAGYALFAIALR